ncbi:hypothetical protein QN277_028945 [Acacia crassicarpa]|uniref:Uncharacterized protein n=1 Tax=Acacia crassicarpa TaxID=499986 RepID=A0AAE1J6S7_9FABA|nr:hypothetical protein QN277_028945 [Acacia crassicarpa]
MASEAIHTEIHQEASETPQQQHVEDEVIINIEKRIQDCGDGDLIEDCCIYKVPITIRGLKEEAYTPIVVSIGPFHYRNERLQDMEKHKQIVFKRFIQKAISSLDDLVHFVRHFEPKIRASYSDTIRLTEQELVEMTLIDVGFIIEFFLMLDKEPVVADINDAKLSQPWLVDSILYDLILLENQLPFFIIEGIFNKAFCHDRCSSLPSFLTCACEVFKSIIPPNLELTSIIKIRHFTDLLRLFYLQGRMPRRHPYLAEVGFSNIPSYNANALQEAGIKLKISTNSTSSCLLDIKLSGHSLEIPQIYVNFRTEILFRNMIALEMCHYPNVCYITDYALALDSLIDTHKDVDLLIEKEIVKSILPDSNEVVRLFNGLPNSTLLTTFNVEYRDICKRLNDYCQNPRYKMMATLRRDYCNTPWRTVASIAGIILLVLTIVQTIFSILQGVQN